MGNRASNRNWSSSIVYKLEIIGYSAVIQSTGDVEMDECNTCRVVKLAVKNTVIGLTIALVWLAASIGILTIAGVA